MIISHHYFDDFVSASAAAANAGTCLEDGDSEKQNDNVFTNLGDAYNQVIQLYISYSCSFVWYRVWFLWIH